MNGLTFARSLIGSGRPEGIGEALDFTLWRVEDRFAVCGGTVGVHALNPLGFVHGGYIATLLDSACGFALLSTLAEGQSMTSINLDTTFHKPLSLPSGRVRAEARITSLGKQIAYAEARLLDDEDKLYATATSSLMILDRR